MTSTLLWCCLFFFKFTQFVIFWEFTRTLFGLGTVRSDGLRSVKRECFTRNLNSIAAYFYGVAVYLAHIILSKDGWLEMGSELADNGSSREPQ